MSITRLKNNPLLSPADLAPTRDDLEILCTMNPGAVRFGEEILLLVRVGEKPRGEPGYMSTLLLDAEAGELKVNSIPLDDPDLDASDPRKVLYRGRMLLTSMSHIRIARSRDGRDFRFDDKPAIFPSTWYEAYGCEDPRITHIDGRYYITYTAVSGSGVAVALAVTEDFRTFRRLGVIFPPFNKDVCIFPEKVAGMYVCRHRPYKTRFNSAAIWTACSMDLIGWGRHEVTLPPTPGGWDSDRVGCGAPPIRTDEGWLEIYHGADETGRYCLGAMLSDLEKPQQVLTRSSRPILQPQADYELVGVLGNVVFSNGMVAGDDGTLTIYYGAADRLCAAAVTTVDEMIAAAKQ